MYVLDQKATISAEVKQPFTPQLYSTHQKIKFTASVKDINTFSAAQQIKAVILQNNRWDNALKDIAPTFVRGNVLQYDSETVSYTHLDVYKRQDTCLSVQMKQAGEIILKDLIDVRESLKKKAKRYKYLTQIGRTHGVHAEPITLGPVSYTHLDVYKRQFKNNCVTDCNFIRKRKTSVRGS